MRGWKNIFNANGKQKKAGVAILISDKIDLKIKNIPRDKQGHYIMIKGSIQKEDTTIVNIYAPDSMRPHRWQPTRLPCWDSLGKNTGVGCHFLLQSMKVKSESEVVQSCPTLSDTMG